MSTEKADAGLASPEMKAAWRSVMSFLLGVLTLMMTVWACFFAYDIRDCQNFYHEPYWTRIADVLNFSADDVLLIFFCGLPIVFPGIIGFGCLYVAAKPLVSRKRFGCVVAWSLGIGMLLAAIAYGNAAMSKTPTYCHEPGM